MAYSLFKHHEAHGTLASTAYENKDMGDMNLNDVKGHQPRSDEFHLDQPDKWDCHSERLLWNI